MGWVISGTGAGTAVLISQESPFMISLEIGRSFTMYLVMQKDWAEEVPIRTSVNQR